MVSEAISIDEYLESDTDVKFEFLYENFSIMKFLIKNYRSDLISEVMDQKASNRRAENGDIGVRVQVSLGVNSPTESMAINKTIIGKAIDEGFLDDEFFKDTDDRQELIRKVTCYHTVNADWEAFSSKLNTMTISDQQILKPYLMKQKSLLDLASEMGIDYRSAIKRVYRLKKKLSDKVLDKIKRGM